MAKLNCMKQAVLMTAEATEKAYGSAPFRHDYLAFDVELPVDELVLEVTFERPGFKVYPNVFFGWSEHGHSAELHRTKGGFRPVQNGGLFVVQSPMVGFRYLVFWVCPD